MRPREAWKLLGIQPGDDERAVKRAYAAKLKAIDPDEDIEGFGRLREALKIAREEARWAKQRAEAGEEPLPAEDDFLFSPQDDFFSAEPVRVDLPLPDPEVTSEVDIAHAEGSAPEPVPYPEPAPPPEPTALQLAFRELDRRLNAHPFKQEDSEAVVAAMEAILGDEALDEIEQSLKVEDALADILSYTRPNSDKAILMADAHFGWREELGKAAPRWHILNVAQRADDIECIAALEDPAHVWHEAWLTLQKSAPKDLSYANRVRLQPRVRELLDSLHRHHIQVEQSLKPDIVDRWNEFTAASPAPELIKSEGISWYGWLIIAFVVLNLLATVVRSLA